MNAHGILGTWFLKKISHKLARTQTWTLNGAPSWGVRFEFRQTATVMMTVLFVAVGFFYFLSRQ